MFREHNGKYECRDPEQPGDLGHGTPERTRSSARYRNSGGYGLGIATLLLSEAATSSRNCSGKLVTIKVSGLPG